MPCWCARAQELRYAPHDAGELDEGMVADDHGSSIEPRDRFVHRLAALGVEGRQQLIQLGLDFGFDPDPTRFGGRSRWHPLWLIQGINDHEAWQRPCKRCHARDVREQRRRTYGSARAAAVATLTCAGHSSLRMSRLADPAGKCYSMPSSRT
jgi:hypothetical protein